MFVNPLVKRNTAEGAVKVGVEGATVETTSLRCPIYESFHFALAFNC